MGRHCIAINLGYFIAIQICITSPMNSNKVSANVAFVRQITVVDCLLDSILNFSILSSTLAFDRISAAFDFIIQLSPNR